MSPKKPTRILDPEILLDELFSQSTKLSTSPGLFAITELPGYLDLFIRSNWESTSTISIEDIPSEGETCALFAISGDRILYVHSRSFKWDTRSSCFVVSPESVSMFIGPEIQKDSSPILYQSSSVGADTEVDTEALAGLLGIMLTELIYATRHPPFDSTTAEDI